MPRYFQNMPVVGKPVMEPFLLCSGLYRLFRGHQVPASTSRAMRCMAVSWPLAFMSSSALPLDKAEVFPDPDQEILRIIREEIDPGQAFIKIPKE